MREVAIQAACEHIDLYRLVSPVGPEFFEGLPWDEAWLRSHSGRIDWNDYAVLIDRFGEDLGSDEAAIRLGETMDEHAPWINVVLSSIVSPIQSLRLWERMAPLFWRCLSLRVEERPPRRAVVTMDLPRELRGCRPFFVSSVGSMRTMPRRFGLPCAVVESYDVGTHHGRYELILPESRTLPARIGRRLGMDGWLDLVWGYSEALENTLSDLGETQARLGAFTQRLEAAGTTGRALARCEDLDAFAAHLGAVLTSGLGCAGMRLTMHPAMHGESPIVRTLGRDHGGQKVRTIQRGGRVLGTLETFEESTEARDLMGVVLPWIELALDRFVALAEERERLDAEVSARKMFVAALDRPSAVWILDADGAVAWANDPARAIGRPPETPDPLAARLTVTDVAGAPGHRLLVLADADAEIAGRLDRVAGRWGLSRAQTEVLEEVVRGRSNKEIGAELGITEGTVEAHLGQVFRRSGSSNRSALVTAFWLA